LCTQGTSFFVALDAGTTSGATVTTRAMTSGSNVLNYSLYQDVSRTANWGNTAGGNTPAATTASTLINPLTVHGRIPKNQNAPAGSYSDTITVTVSY
jgi:spore coat protein U-like protein